MTRSFKVSKSTLEQFILADVTNLLDDMIEEVENIEDEERMEAEQERMDNAQKMFDESDDVDELLDSLCILNGCDGDCSIWEFMDGLEEQYAEAVINKLRRRFHFTIIAATLSEYKQYNPGCIMFDDYIQEHTENEDEYGSDYDRDDESVDEDEDPVKPVSNCSEPEKVWSLGVLVDNVDTDPGVVCWG